MKGTFAVFGIVLSSFFATSLARPGVVLAQPAADKATARQLATEGIQLYRQERFKESLDKMERAETLYDAPIHLLYIARCYSKLGKLVESAEIYRRLVRVELSAQAPQTFRDAVADGQKELTEIEPKIPALRIEVAPATAKGLRLRIDDEAVSTAVLGVNRPINPGMHTIQVEAQGFLGASKSVSLDASSKQSVSIELVPVSGANSGGSATAKGNGATASGNADQAGASGDASRGAMTAAYEPLQGGAVTKPGGRRPVKIVLGLGYSGLLAAGQIDKSTETSRTGKADDRSLNGRFGIASQFELRAGVSLPVGTVRITPHLFGDLAAHKAGTFYSSAVGDNYGFAQPKGAEPSLESTSYSVQVGLGARIDSAPTERLHIGGFGELGLIPKEVFLSNIKFSPGTTELANRSCKFKETFSGSALRLGGGVLLPVAKMFAAEARATWTVGQFSTQERTPACELVSGSPALAAISETKIPADDRRFHHVLTIGIGGQFEIGL